MTKKHFELVAEMIKLGRSLTIQGYDAKTIAKDQATMAIKLFAKENFRFDKNRFLEACGLL